MSPTTSDPHWLNGMRGSPWLLRTLGLCCAVAALACYTLPPAAEASFTEPSSVGRPYGSVSEGVSVVSVGEFSCPINFLDDNTQEGTPDCYYIGRWNVSCGEDDLEAVWRSDGQNLVVAFLGFSPGLFIGATVTGPNTASIVGWFTEPDGSNLREIAGSVNIGMNGTTLRVLPGQAPFLIDGCDLQYFIGALEAGESCGNGAAEEGEECDDGNRNNGDGCDNNCRRTGCGNGIVTDGEGCDDGNLLDGDGCDAGCTLSETATPTPVRTLTATETPMFASTFTETATATRSQTPTPTRSPTRTATPIPKIVTIQIGDVTGLPGTTVRLEVSLSSSGESVVATSNDIRFDPSVVEISPEQCQINHKLKNVLVASVAGSGDDVMTLRVFVLSTQDQSSIPDGVLYTCDVGILPSAIPDEYFIENRSAQAFGPNGVELRFVEGEDGFVTVTLVPRRCSGDCNADGEVTVDELVRGVNIGLGGRPVGDCPGFDSNGDGLVSINELISAVNAALGGCGARGADGR